MDGWHVVYCKPMQDEIAAENLMRQGFEIYRPVIGKNNKKPKSLFPRYLFLRTRNTFPNFMSVTSTRGVVTLVKFGSHFPALPNEMIELIRAQEKCAAVEPMQSRTYQPGEPVEVKIGEAVLTGQFYQYSSDKRVSILLKILGEATICAVNLADIVGPFMTA